MNLKNDLSQQLSREQLRTHVARNSPILGNQKTHESKIFQSNFYAEKNKYDENHPFQ